MPQKTYMYDTQWNQLINAINTGDSSAIVTAISNIKISLDNITNAISNQSITLDFSNINSDNVSNLSNVQGSTVTNALSLLNDMLTNVNIKSITRIVGTYTTGSTGNIGIGIPNDGKQFVFAPLASGYNAFFRVWVSSANNNWYLKAIDPETGATINNTQMAVRFLLLKLKES